MWCICLSDEKEKYDPAGFRDYIVIGLNAAGSDVDAIWKFLDSAGSKVDYRRYGEALFDILIAGGLLGKEIIHMAPIAVICPRGSVSIAQQVPCTYSNSFHSCFSVGHIISIRLIMIICT